MNDPDSHSQKIDPLDRLDREFASSYEPQESLENIFFFILGPRGMGKSRLLEDFREKINAQKIYITLGERVFKPQELCKDPQSLIDALCALKSSTPEDASTIRSLLQPGEMKAFLEELPPNKKAVLFLDETEPVYNECLIKLLAWLLLPFAQTRNHPIRVVWARQTTLPRVQAEVDGLSITNTDVLVKSWEKELKEPYKRADEQMIKSERMKALLGYYQLRLIEEDEFEDLQRMCLPRIYHAAIMPECCRLLLRSGWRGREWFEIQGKLENLDLSEYSGENHDLAPRAEDARMIRQYYHEGQPDAYTRDNWAIAQVLLSLNNDKIMQDLWWLVELIFHLAQAGKTAIEIEPIMLAALKAKPPCDPKLENPQKACIEKLLADKDLHNILGHLGVEHLIKSLSSWR